MSNIENCIITTVNVINNYPTSKQCAKCKTMKPLSEYNIHKRHSDGYCSSCKICTNSQRRAVYPRNKEKVAERNKIWYQNNKGQRIEYNRQYRENNREKFNESRKNKYHTNIQFKLRMNLKNRLHDALKGNNKSEHTLELLDCSLEFLYLWLTSQLEEGDKLEDFEIDHVRPCASFDLTDPLQQKECFCWRNLQPLTKQENNMKNDKRDFELEAAHTLKAQNFLNK